MFAGDGDDDDARCASWVARVEVENECAALREALAAHQQTTRELLAELDEERSASASAATEAMSMILRLQREKAQVQMEARQYKRFAEERIAHDQSEIRALEELLYKRDQLAQALRCEVQAFRHRLLGLGDGEVVADEVFNEILDRKCESEYQYPWLKCIESNQTPVSPDGDSEKCILEDSYHDWEQLGNLEWRIEQLERKPSGNSRNGGFTEKHRSLSGKGRRVDGCRQFSHNSPRSLSSGIVPMESPRCDWNGYSKRNGSRKLVDSSEHGDDMNDRVYTVDYIQGVSCAGNGLTGYGTTGGPLQRVDIGDADIMKLYTRLQALEADRESMRQTLISMSTDNAQLVLLKEIAQHLCKDLASERRLIVRKPSSSGAFSSVSLVKWVLSFVFSRKRAPKSKNGTLSIAWLQFPICAMASHSSISAISRILFCKVESVLKKEKARCDYFEHFLDICYLLRKTLVEAISSLLLWGHDLKNQCPKHIKLKKDTYIHCTKPRICSHQKLEIVNDKCAWLLAAPVKMNDEWAYCLQGL